MTYYIVRLDRRELYIVRLNRRDLVGRVIDWLNSSINYISTNFDITALYLINNRLNNFVNTKIAVSRNLVINW